MKKTERISALIVLIIFLQSEFLFSAGQNVKRYSWGSLQVAAQNSNQVKMKLSLEPADINAGSAVLSQRVIYYALSPSEEIRPSVTGFVAAPVSLKGVYRVQHLPSTHDTTTVKQTLEQIPAGELPSAPNVSVIGYGWYRGYYLARIEVTPFYNNVSTHAASFAQTIDVQLNKVRTKATTDRLQVKMKDSHFDRILRELIVNFDEAQPYQMPAFNDTTGGWFSTSAKYIKLAIPNDGIYRITETQLDSIYPAIAGVDPRTFQVFDRGKEIPIYVSGDSDGVFNPGDYLEFPALRNYTGKHRIITTALSQEYNEYLNRYTDSTILWLTWGTTNGVRMSQNPLSIATTDTLKTYTAFIHMEVQGPSPGLQNSATDDYSSQDYRWNPFDLWPWGFLSGSGTVTKYFIPTDVVTKSDSVTLYAKIASWGANVSSAAHKIAIRMNNGNDLNTVTLNLGGQNVLRGRTLADSLKNSKYNSVLLYSYPTAATTNNIIYDWFEIEYPRQLKVIGDSLLFDFRTLTDRHFRNVQISGLQSSNFLLYRIKPTAERISNYKLSGSAPYTVTFCDTVGSQEQYVVVAQSKVYTPVFTTIKGFAGLRSNKSQTDYIAITHPKFYSEAIQYVQNVVTAKQLNARLFSVNDIFDEFGFGYPTAEAIQSFVQSSFQWTSPLPSYLTLLGDASYDYKYYFGNYTAVNYVPSVGYPVSDVAYALLDTVMNLPQMYVGRIPMNNAGDLTQYLSFYNSTITTPSDDWNKHYLFFTGGDPTIPGQIDLLKSVNSEVASTLVAPAPIGGIATHFYKTVNPQSDFGPFTTQQVEDAISTGGVFISYIGHSGTQTWDNSIGDPLQLKNSRGRYPLITDMGCSTGKFAEPQIQSFSELFIVGPVASAIGYIGNSSLGYESIATSLPPIFYSAMLKDSIVRVGVAHLTAKLRQISQQGLSTVNQIMLFNNTLIGDPTVDLKIPFVPNLSIQANLINSLPTVLTDDQDSAAVNIVYANYGSVTSDSVDVQIQHMYHSQVIQSWLLRRPMALDFDTLTVNIAIKQKADEHDVVVTLDPSNKITELRKDDNSATKAFFVSSTDFKIVQPQPMSVALVPHLVLLNPTTQLFDPTKLVTLEVDTLSDYSTPVKPLAMSVPMGVVSTSFSLASLQNSKRYYWRAKFQTSSGNWSTGSFYQGTDPSKAIGQIDSIGWKGNSFVHTLYSPLSGSKIANTTTVLQGISGGFFDGNFGAVEFNGVNKLPSTLARGHSIVVIDPSADTVIKQGTYDLYGHAAYADSIAQFLNSIPNGEIVVAVIINDGWTNITAAVKNAYHGIGSTLIDSVQFRDSWAIVGRKGAIPGSVQESWKKSTTGKAILDTTIVQNEASGSITTPAIGPVSSWNLLTLNRVVPVGARLTVSMLGNSNSGTIDTLFASYDSLSVNLQNISAVRYPSARLLFNFVASPSLASPVLSDWSIKAQLPPELVLSQNTVSLEKSTFQEGEIITVGASVFNVGPSAADSVLVSILTDDSGALRTLKNTIAPLVNPQDSVRVLIQYDSEGKRGDHSFTFRVDPNNVITEYYKSNNTAVIPYKVIADTVPLLLPNLAIDPNSIIVPATVPNTIDSIPARIVIHSTGSARYDSVDILVQQIFQASAIRTWTLRIAFPLISDTVVVYPGIKGKAGEHTISVVIDPQSKFIESSKDDNSASNSFFVATTDFTALQPTSSSVSYVPTMILLNPSAETWNGVKKILLDIDTLNSFATARHFTTTMGQFSTSIDISSLRKMTRNWWRAKVENGTEDWTVGTFFEGDTTESATGQVDSIAWSENSFVHAAYSKAVGAHIQNTPTHFRVVSAGFADGNFGDIEVNGINIIPGTPDTCHYIAVLDTNYNLVAQRQFGLYSNPAQADSLTSFINAVHAGFYVIAVIIGEGSNNFSTSARTAYKLIGSKFVDQIGWRDSWAIIGKKGAVSGSVPESYQLSTTGKASLDTTYFHKESVGTVVTQKFGPIASWKNLAVRSIVPSGSSFSIAVAGISRRGAVDTVASATNPASLNVQNVSARQYPNGKLVFTLRQNNAAVSPSVQQWTLTSQPPTELALSPATVFVQKTTMHEGEVSNLSMKLFNVSGVDADSVTAEILTDDSGFPRTLTQTIFPVIHAQDSAIVQTQYDSRGKHGSHSFYFKIDPDSTLPEIDKSNNSFSISYTVIADTVRPTLDVTFDGAHVLDGDFVSVAPTVVLQMKDDNAAPLTLADTSSFFIFLNGEKVSFASAERIQFDPVKSQVVWKPILPDGENSFKYFAQDVSGNSSDTTVLVAEVASKMELMNLYNIPNPFRKGTTFTFMLSGAGNPQSAHIKIYTVAGRLIQDLDFSSKVHIGTNGYTNSDDNLYWNGRDKDGDDIANGVYFYRVVVSGNGQQAAATQKLVKMR